MEGTTDNYPKKDVSNLNRLKIDPYIILHCMGDQLHNKHRD